MWCYRGRSHGRSHGERGEFSPKPKNCCRKMKLFPKALFVVTNIPKIIKKFNLSIEFSSKNFQNFPTMFVSFRSNARKINTWFVNFWKICKNNAFFAIFLRKILKIFENSPASGGLSPQKAPTRPTPKVFPPNQSPHAHGSAPEPPIISYVIFQFFAEKV